MRHLGAHIPRPIASITDLGGEYAPLRQAAWLRLFSKDYWSVQLRFETIGKPR
jgi:hypothetical protein